MTECSPEILMPMTHTINRSRKPAPKNGTISQHDLFVTRNWYLKKSTSGTGTHFLVPGFGADFWQSINQSIKNFLKWPK